MKRISNKLKGMRKTVQMKKTDIRVNEIYVNSDNSATANSICKNFKPYTVKKGALGFVTLAILTAILLAGCQTEEKKTFTTNPSVTTNPDAKHEEYLELLQNPDFEIDEANVTAAQVFANLNELAAVFVELDWTAGTQQDRDDSFWASFVSFGPKILGYRLEEDEDNYTVYEKYDIYAILEKQKTPDVSWLTHDVSPFYKNTTDPVDGYFITLQCHYSEHNRSSDREVENLLVSKKEYEAVLDAFGVQKHVLTLEEIKDSANYMYWSDYVGTEVYDAFTLDRQKVQNATSEQLLAINNMIKAMYNINLLNFVGENTPTE